MNNSFSLKVIRYWPHFVGVEQLMGILHPSPPPVRITESKVKGFPLRIRYCPQTCQGRFLYFRGIYEEGVIRKLKSLMKPGMNFVDVGANVGLYTIIASHLVGQKGKVIAFEPQSKLRNVLMSNLELNNLRNVTVRPEALGRRATTGRLHQVSRSNDGQATLEILGHEETFAAPESVTVVTLANTLSNLDIPRIDGIKIDVEGGELDVLIGLKPILETNQPAFIFFECIDQHLCRFGSNSSQLFEYLQHFGYNISCLWRGKWRRLKSVAEHERYNFSPDCLAIKDS